MKTWLSVYLYFNGPLDVLLIDFVLPVKQELYGSGVARSFFFIRYAEKGPHVRLRVLLASQTMKLSLLDRISRITESYNQRDLKNEIRAQFVDYQPEIERYGNDRTIHLAHQMFNISSEAVLQWLNACDELASGQRLTTALLMHTGFVAACLEIETQISFLDEFTKLWLPEDLNDPSPRHQQQEVWGAVFQRRYEHYLPGIVSYVDHYYHLVKRQEKTGTDWLDQFVARTLAAHQAYSQLVTDQGQLLTIYQSFIHMTNNRLGLANHDEPFISYLLSRCLQQIRGQYGS